LVPPEEAVKPPQQCGQTGPNRGTGSLFVEESPQAQSSSSPASEASAPYFGEGVCLMARKKSKKKKKAKGGKTQMVEVSSSVDEELKHLKSEHALLVQRYNSLENDHVEYLSIVLPSIEEHKMLVAQLEKLTSEHMTLQATHKELERSYEKLVDSYAILDIAHEVVLSSVKSIQPL